MSDSTDDRNQPPGLDLGEGWLLRPQRPANENAPAAPAPSSTPQITAEEAPPPQAFEAAAPEETYTPPPYPAPIIIPATPEARQASESWSPQSTPQPRHSRESGNPDAGTSGEIPAFAGMTAGGEQAQASEAPPAPPTATIVAMPEPKRPEPRKPELVAKDSGLVVKNLGKTYAKRPVVRNVSVSLQRGEAVGLLGPNGAGKTTCFYMITGLVAPDYGTIYMDGTDITNLPMYRRARLGIGYLPQEASIFRGLTVEQNIMAVLEVSESDPTKRHAMCDELLAEFSITHLRNSPAIALSGGERRRCEIARALAGRPAFILLDEPLAGIDPIAIADVRDLVSHLKHRGIGVLITDHNVRETLDVIDRAYIIHDGSVLMEGSPSDIVNNHEVRRVYLGEKFSL